MKTGHYINRQRIAKEKIMADKKKAEAEAKAKAEAEAKKKAEAEAKKKAEGTKAEEKEKKQPPLIAEACKAYGIDSEYVFSSGIDKETGEAVIVTNGGKRVRYAKGDEVVELSQIEITGINPEWKKRKPITGKK
jgi:hypothetical protein